MVRVSEVSFPAIKSAVNSLRTTVKNFIPTFSQANKDQHGSNGDEFEYNTEAEARSYDERVNNAVRNFNAANKDLTNMEIALSGVNDPNSDGRYPTIVPLLTAYQNPEIEFSEYTPVSADTVIATV